MTPSIQVRQVTTRRDLLAFVKFPWRVYEGDSNWVPPLISERLDYLNPKKNPFYQQAEVSLFLAHRGHEVVGTIAPFYNKWATEHLNQREGGFGFFEVIEDYAIAHELLDTARQWAKASGMTTVRGPTNFTNNDTPGVLVDGADCPPVMLAAHTPAYYQTFLERYGMEKSEDSYAWRVFRSQVGAELEKVPPELFRVARAARLRSGVTIRRARFDNWTEEIVKAHSLFNTTLSHFPDHVPMSRAQFFRMADQLRPFLDSDLILFAEIDSQPIGFSVAIPDINRVLIHLNGRLFPVGWLKLWWYSRHIDVVSFKLMGILEEYRRRGIDALLYLEILKTVFAKGYKWMDGSLTSEENLAVNLVADRLGAERYKHYRIYKMSV